MNLPTVNAISFSVKCRQCGLTFQYLDTGIEKTSEDIELHIHETLDEKGWVDGQCPRCVNIQIANL